MPYVRSAMDRVVERLEQQLATLRSGRASAGMLDRIQVRACTALVTVTVSALACEQQFGPPCVGHSLCGGRAMKQAASALAFRQTTQLSRSLCDRQAEAYGERMPLSALATTLVRDPQLLVVNVFDPSVRSQLLPCQLPAIP